MRKINIGQPHDDRKDWIGIDIQSGSDIVRDIDKGLPFDDNSVDEVYSSYCLEHVKDIVFVMNEIHRVCKPNAIVKIIVPTVYGDAAFQDPTHKVFFNRTSFVYYCLGSGQKQAKHTGVKGFFEMIDQSITDDNNGKLTVTLKVVK